MAVGDPVQGDQLIISVSATAVGAKTQVKGLNRFGGRKSRTTNRTHTFMRGTPYVSRGSPDYTYTLTGLYIPSDAGQQLIRDAEAAGTSVFLTVLPNGVDGKMQEVLVGQLSHDGDPENIQAYGFELTGVSDPVVVGLGPIP